MSLRAPLARGLRLHSLAIGSPLPRSRIGDPTTARWICNHCRRASRAHGVPAFHMAALLSSRRHAAAEISSPTISALLIRSFTAGRWQHSNGEPEEKESAVASQPETFDQRLKRMVHTTRCSWNELVGYTDIEKERKRVEQQELTIEQKRLELQEARDEYRMAVDKHAASLRESRDLLGRRDEWSESDAARFAALHTMVKTNEQAEYGTRQALSAAELGLEREIERLSSKIGAVYQAESMYNAKILQMKTWWTWALFIFNASVFVFNLYLLQVGLNPKSKKAEVVLADDTIRRLSSRLAESVGSVSKAQTKTAAPVMDAQQPLGPLLIHNGNVFYKDSNLDLDPADTIATMKERLLSIEGMPSSRLLLVSNGAELEDESRLDELPMDARHTIEIFTFDSIEGNSWALDMDEATHSVHRDSLPDRAKNLFSDQVIAIRARDATFTVLQSALAGAMVASLVFLGLERG